MSFIRQKEDFICDFCGVSNLGDGYTNHCHSCLYSKHVDVEPGDRLSTCGGLMKPIFVSYTSKDPYILHKCVKCSFEKKNKVQMQDSIETMARIQATLK
ncbi:MAG: RNHCP domain-containing protein [Patescibacteria group bacterium]